MALIVETDFGTDFADGIIANFEDSKTGQRVAKYFLNQNSTPVEIKKVDSKNLDGLEFWYFHNGDVATSVWAFYGNYCFSVVYFSLVKEQEITDNLTECINSL